MNTKTLSEIISLLKKASLKNWESHQKMAPALRLRYSDERIQKNNPKDAAVLILLYPDKQDKIHILLTKRARYNGAHSAQISFPGGKKDKNDNNLLQTALREAKEEVNIQPNQLTFIKELSKTYIPPSNFWVHPYVFITNQKPDFKLNYEVEHLIEIPLTELLNDANLHTKNLSTSYMKNIDVPCFKFNNEIVWGATAMILSELKDALIGS